MIKKPPAPKTRKELFERLVAIHQHGEYVMPDERYSGTGGPGLFLEDLLGLTSAGRDIPDALEWELKYYTLNTHLITLFHKEPQPEGIMRYMVNKYGWKDDKGRLSFRHTINGESDRFRVDSDAGQVVVRPIKGNGSVPYWTEDDLLSSAGAKLRRLVLVRGKKNGQKVTYDRIDYYETLQLSFFIWEVVKGSIAVDFDARESSPGSKGLRNHGTKFRIAPENICRLYARKERIC